MIISSFFRMRCFREDKASLVLKLCLPFFRPELTSEESLCERLNSFYAALAEEYFNSLCKGVQSISDRLIVSVGFTIATDKYSRKYERFFRKRKNTVVIERYIRSSIPFAFLAERHIDLWDLGRGFLLK